MKKRVYCQDIWNCNKIMLQLSSIVCFSVAKSCLWPYELQHSRLPCPSTICQSLLKPMSIESVMTSKPSHSLLSPSPPALNLSQHLFLWVGWPKYWSFSITRSNEYSGLISFRIYWFDLLAVQGTPKGLLQYHSSVHWERILIKT